MSEAYGEIEKQIEEISALMDEVRGIGFSSKSGEMSAFQNITFLVELQSQKNNLILAREEFRVVEARRSDMQWRHVSAPL